MHKLLKLTSISLFAAAMATGFTLTTSLNAEAAQPLEVYAELPKTASVRVSPDGKRLAMLSPYKGSKAIFVYDLLNLGAKVKVIPTPKDARVKAISWGGPENVIFFSSYNTRGIGKMRKYGFRFGRWASTNVVTGKSIIWLEDETKTNTGVRQTRKMDGNGSRAFGSNGSPVNLLPNDDKHILVRFSKGGPRLWKVNLDTGKGEMTRILPDRTDSVIFDPSGENLVARSSFNFLSNTVQAFAISGGKENKVYERKFDKDVNPTVSLVSVLPENGKLLFVEGEQEELTLFTVDPVSGEQAPYRLNVNVPGGYEYGPILDPHTREIIGVGYTDDLSNQIYFKEPYQGWNRKLKKALKGKNVSILSWTRDHSMVTVYAEGKRDAGEYFLYEPKAGALSTLGKRYPALGVADVSETKRADFVARDGEKIPAYLTLPPGKTKADGPFPLIALPHGGPIARDDASFDFWAQYLTSRGYAVFKPQFRGSTGFGYSYTEKGYGEFGGGMVTDTIDGVRHLIKTGVADKDRMCVTGASYGGYQALALPMVEPDMFKCALSVNGVSHIKRILEYESARSGSQNSPTVRFWNRVIGDYHSDRDKMKRQSPAQNIEKIKAEIVLVHGEDDLTVPFEQSKIMAKALKSIGQSDDLIVLPNDDHNLSWGQSRKTMLEASDALFEKHLGK